MEDKLFEHYKLVMQKAADINYSAALLGWDQETYMPPKGAEYRGRQLATLTSLGHELVTSDHFGEILRELLQNEHLHQGDKKNVELSHEDYERNKKLSPEFVEALSKQTSECFNAWIAARKKNDYSIYAPSLEKMIVLKRKQADLYGYNGHPYDALVDEYEKGATVAILDPLFAGIRQELPKLLNKIKERPQVSNECFHKHYPKEQQWDFGMEVLSSMGFDFEAGRQDYSEHPFTTSFAPTDVRITTRVDENNYASMLWSCIHEGGHGLYEQGLPENEYGLPLGSPASLGIHESQSRFWENCIGRGISFWKHFFPKLQGYFPEQLKSASADDIFKAANRVEPSFIRTEADELTYHFHIMIRYEIEKKIIGGELQVKDIPEEWNNLYEHFLGIRPKDFKTGVLQDVHWSHGSFGYFPTYTLGSFYAAQFFLQAKAEIKDLDAQIEKGEFSVLLHWLREKIHRHGRRYTSQELCKLVTGNELMPEKFFTYAWEKYGRVYGF